jgi:hypothetical protein
MSDEGKSWISAQDRKSRRSSISPAWRYCRIVRTPPPNRTSPPFAASLAPPERDRPEPQPRPRMAMLALTLALWAPVRPVPAAWICRAAPGAAARVMGAFVDTAGPAGRRAGRSLACTISPESVQRGHKRYGA